MRKASYTAVLATLAAVAMALAGASSAAPARPGHAPGVAGSNVVKQVGKRNYAGPNCPGRGWNCTTSRRVLQIATAGGDNVAQCTNTTPVVDTGSQKCTISQLGASGSTNYAKCYERTKAVPAGTQDCTIIQTGASNTAIVDQLIVQTQGSIHKGTQTASVTQGSVTQGSGVLNSSSVSQDVKQNTAGSGAAVEDNAEEQNLAASGGPQSQDAYQSATVKQYAGGSGKNDSQVDQSEWQKAHGGSSQDQNTILGSADCAPLVGAFRPNVCANVAQYAASGTNANRLSQSIDQNAKLLVVGSQRQGSFGTNGIDGQVHQETDVGGPGSSSNTVNESKHHDESAPPTSLQIQIDPISCCGTASQIGGTGNHESITQSAALMASAGNLASQVVGLFGSSNSDPGSCTFNQHASVNTGSADNSGTVGPTPPCLLVTASINCTSGPPIGDIILVAVVPLQVIEPPPPPCVASPPTGSTP